MEETTRIGQIMAPAQDVINQNEDVRTARRRLESEAKRSLIVVDGDVPVGVLEWRTLMHHDVIDDEMPVSDLMIQELPTMTAEMTIEEARGHLADIDMEVLPVIDDSGHLIGEISRSVISHREEVVDEALAASIGESKTPDSQVASSFSSLARGMKVIGSGGSKIGEVGDLTVGPDGELDAIIVSHGLLGRKHKRVSADVVDIVDDDQVVLAIDQQEFKRLPEADKAREGV